MFTESQIKILNVDESETGREKTTQALEQIAYTVLEAGSEDEALRMVSENKPHLVLLNSRLRELEGDKLCKQLKANEVTASIPVLMVSSFLGKDEQKIRELESGPDAYLVRPIQPLELIATVKALLRIGQTETELRDSQEELTDFFENAPIGVHWLGANGKILRANRAELDMLGYSSDEYVGHYFSEFYVDVADLHNFLNRLKNGETICNYEANLRAKDRSIRNVLISSNVLWKEGQFVHSRCFIRDVTALKQAEKARATLLISEQFARKQAEESEKLLESLQSVTDAVLAKQSLEELLNEMLWQMRKLFAADVAAILLLNKDRESLQVKATSGCENEFSDEVLLDPEVRGEIAVSRKSIILNDLPGHNVCGTMTMGKYRSLIGTPLLAEGRLIGVIHANSVKRSHFTDEDLKLLLLIADRVALAIEKARLYEAEQEARKVAETANKLKDEFLATVSHELRAPLNAIQGWVHLLRDGRLKGKEAEHALETVERSARAQNRIISDLLDVSQIITGKLRLSSQLLYPVRVIEETIDSVRPAAEAKSIRIVIILDQGAGPIYGDPVRLQQMIWNLLSNAIKFTPKGGCVMIQLERVDTNVQLTVSDTGTGINPEFLPFAFDHFRQADSSNTRRQGGLGLGLAIVRHLVEMHGGTVSAESRGEGEGTKVIVCLPLLFIKEDNSHNASSLLCQTKAAGREFVPHAISKTKIKAA